MIKQNKILLSCLLFILLAAACKKNELRMTQFDLPADKAYIRFALLSPNTPSVMLKVNDVKLNGTSTGFGGLFPSVVNTPDYSAVPPNGTFKLSLPNTGTANDSIVIFNGPFAVDAGKFYAITLADTGVDRTVFAIQDQLGALPDSGFFNLRLINAMPKTAALNLIRVDSTTATAVIRDTIARNVAYKSATNYIKTAVSPATGYSFLRFRTVTTAGVPVGSLTPPAGSTLNRRSMTTYAFGFGNGTTTLAPGLTSFVYNQ